MAVQNESSPPQEFLDDMAVIGYAAGLKADMAEGQDLIQDHLAPALTEVFLDGEMHIARPGKSDARTEFWVGRRRYSEGAYAAVVNRLRDGSDTPEDVRGALDRVANILGRKTGRETAHDVYRSFGIGRPRTTIYDLSDAAIGGVELLGTQVRLNPSAPMITLPRAPRHVLHYGPSLQGGAMVDEQVRQIESGGVPFVYHAATKGPFIGAHLRGYFARMLELSMRAPEAEAEQAAGMYVDFDPRGLAVASRELLISGRTPFGRSDEIHKMGLVVCSGLHTAGAAELGEGFRNAHALLEDDGGMVLRALAKTTGRGDVSGDQMLELAREAGFAADGSNVQSITSRIDGRTITSYAGFLTKT